MRIRTHAPGTDGGERGEFRLERAAFVEKFVRLVALHPRLQHLEMRGIGTGVAERNLVGAKRAFDRLSVDHLRTGPSLGGRQHDHRPPRSQQLATRSGGSLTLKNLADDS